MDSEDLRNIGISVLEGEFVVTHADGSGRSKLEPLTELLGRVRSGLGMDVVFVSQFLGDERVVRYVADSGLDVNSITAGHSDPLEESYCHHVVEARLPLVMPNTNAEPLAVKLAITDAKKIRSYITAPIVGKDGGVYGTVCCLHHEVISEEAGSRSHALLSSIAALITRTVASEPETQTRPPGS